MKYLEGSFSVFPGSNAKYRANYDLIDWGKKDAKPKDKAEPKKETKQELKQEPVEVIKRDTSFDPPKNKKKKNKKAKKKK